MSKCYRNASVKLFFYTQQICVCVNESMSITVCVCVCALYPGHIKCLHWFVDTTKNNSGSTI